MTDSTNQDSPDSGRKTESSELVAKLSTRATAFAVASDYIDPEQLHAPHAVLDWVDLRLTLRAPTQGQHLRRWFVRHGFTYFDPCDEGTGLPFPKDRRNTTTSVFIARLQNPGSPADAQQKLADIDQRHPFAAAPVCVGVEVSLLFRLRNPPDEKTAHKQRLAAQAELIYRNLANPVSLDHRILRPKGMHISDPLSRDVNRAELFAGYPIFIGHRDDPLGQRIYVATNDRKGPSGRRPQPKALWCVKLETIMQGEAMPFRSLEDWATFDFECLSRRYFALRKPKQGIPIPVGVACFARRTSAGRRQKFNPVTEADSNATERVRIALRNLTKRNKTGFQHPIECRILDRSALVCGSETTLSEGACIPALAIEENETFSTPETMLKKAASDGPSKNYRGLNQYLSPSLGNQDQESTNKANEPLSVCFPTRHDRLSNVVQRRHQNGAVYALPIQQGQQACDLTALQCMSN